MPTDTKPAADAATLDAQVAERVMGLRAYRLTYIGKTNSEPGKSRWQFLTEMQAELFQQLGDYRVEESERPEGEPVSLYGLRPYSTDPTAARAMEDRIEELGKAREYARALDAIVEADNPDVDFTGVVWTWYIAHATPEQRVRAALAVFGQKQ